MTAAVDATTEFGQRPQRTRFRIILRSLRGNQVGFAAGVVVCLFVVVALAAPVIAPHDPIVMTPLDRLQAPSGKHWLGTDFFGRDILSRILYGARISLAVGGVSVAGSATVGTILGLIAGYVGRWPEYVIMRLMDILFAFPAILLAILVVTVVGQGFASIIVAIATVQTPIFARVVRGPALSLKHVEFVQAAIASGAPTRRVLFRHVLPNISGPILVQLALSLSGAIVVEAALSFLGLGAVPPTPSLGSMLSENRNYMEMAPWTVLYPGLALGLLVLAVNMLGDMLRDLLDPRLRSQL